MRAAVAALLLAPRAAAAAAPGAAGCDCGSTDASQPCNGTSATRTVGSGDDAVRFSFSFSCGGGACACGRFLNGEYWVAAPGGGGAVTIVAAPEPSGANDGLA
eukprot:gene7718-4660_t